MSIVTHPFPRELTKSVRASVLVFEDPKSRALLRRIARVAPSEASVIIVGETGTGKELIARQIHQQSHRSERPFVAVNCGAFPETLVESELFGHEKGAFTGAIANKSGWFEAADGGTLFLDEIGDLPLSMQVKLLRVLQEREIVRLGSRTPKPIDVRLIAATNINLSRAVAAGHFREDLFYRLHVAAIELPPLRERVGDILPLAEFFLEEHTRRLGYAPATLSHGAIAKLLSHPWPGNIRELENVIHHALLVRADREVLPEDLHLAERVREAPEPGPWPQSAVRVPQEARAPQGRAPHDECRSDLPAALVELFERNEPDLYEHIEEVLFRTAYQYCQGNQLQTARLLGISRNIVRARLEKIGELGRGGPDGVRCVPRGDRLPVAGYFGVSP